MCIICVLSFALFSLPSNLFSVDVVKRIYKLINWAGAERVKQVTGACGVERAGGGGGGLIC